ncbi:AIR carboxylase family protein [Nanoarchaeota archaeon]
MIDEKFKEIMRANTGCAAILAGSGSDDGQVVKVAGSLRDYEIPYMTRICSAHKQPEELMAIIKELNAAGGSIAYVAIAGGTDALSGTLSFHALGPVISCPPDSPNESCLTNPPGSSSMYVRRANNVGKAIAQMYAGVNPRFRELIEKINEDKLFSLRESDRKSTEMILEYKDGEAVK